MGTITRAIGGIAISLAIGSLPAAAMPLRVTPVGRNPPDRFYAIPLSRVRGLTDPNLLRAKITCCSWGPWTMSQTPNTEPGQWYIYPVCGRGDSRALVLSETLVGPTDSRTELACP